MSSEGYRQHVIVALGWFSHEAPNTRLLRDVLEHVDEYAIGAGRHDLPTPDRWGVITFVDDETPEGLLGEVTYDFGGVQVELHRLANAAMHLADVLHGLWEAEFVG